MLPCLSASHNYFSCLTCYPVCQPHIRITLSVSLTCYLSVNLTCYPVCQPHMLPCLSASHVTLSVSLTCYPVCQPHMLPCLSAPHVTLSVSLTCYPVCQPHMLPCLSASHTYTLPCHTTSLPQTCLLRCLIVNNCRNWIIMPYKELDHYSWNLIWFAVATASEMHNTATSLANYEG